MIGEKYGTLTLTGKTKRNKWNYLQVHCVCCCGAEGYVIYNSLKIGKTKTCTRFEQKKTESCGIITIHTHSGRNVIIDKESINIIYNKTVSVRGDGYCYLRIEGKKRYLHRLIMGSPKGLFIDHKNNDPSDNRLSNLRIASSKENSYNKKLNIGKIGHKGVQNRNGRFEAHIRFNGNQIYLGMHDSEKEAAIVYDKKAIELFGEFACTNKSMGLL